MDHRVVAGTRTAHPPVRLTPILGRGGVALFVTDSRRGTGDAHGYPRMRKPNEGRPVELTETQCRGRIGNDDCGEGRSWRGTVPLRRRMIGSIDTGAHCAVDH